MKREVAVNEERERVLPVYQVEMPCLFISLPYFVWACIPYISHKFTGFCLNLINLREIMSCMPRKGKGAIVHEVFENVTPRSWKLCH